MQQDIDFDHRRSNVDSAKKRAVLQHMDYDGFRQMVLGANLKPVKAGAATEIYKREGYEGNINHVATYNQIIGLSSDEDGMIGYDEEVVRRTLELSQSDKLNPPENSREFEKFLVAKLKDPLQRYTYMRLINFEQIEAIFTEEFDAEVFLVIVDTFTKMVIDNAEFNNASE